MTPRPRELAIDRLVLHDVAPGDVDCVVDAMTARLRAYATGTASLLPPPRLGHGPERTGAQAADAVWTAVQARVSAGVP